MSLAPAVETYLTELGKRLSPLPAAERDEIVAEVRAHFAERGSADALAEFDPVDVYAAQFLEVHALEKAVAKGGPVAIGSALVRGARFAAETVFIVVPLLVVEVVAFALGLMALVKPFFFHHAGYFVDAEGHLVFLGIGRDMSRYRDVLGWWTVPVFLLPSILAFYLALRGLRLLAARRLARLCERA